MIEINEYGSFSKTTDFLRKIKKIKIENILKDYGRKGVVALSAATPVGTGETSASWYYTIEVRDNTSYLYFCNSHVEDKVNIAIILQYGHATRNGGYVEGINYINPALRNVFIDLSNELWEEVANI